MIITKEDGDYFARLDLRGTQCGWRGAGGSGAERSDGRQKHALAVFGRSKSSADATTPHEARNIEVAGSHEVERK